MQYINIKVICKCVCVLVYYFMKKYFPSWIANFKKAFNSHLIKSNLLLSNTAES